MRERWHLYVADMIDAGERIIEYTADHGYESFSRTQMLVDAVIRNIEVLGEAAGC